ncbi:MAG: zinc metallopeptidase [Planctomycetota bacterium]|nr:zinc metallopeptidase [Planctomycetota bacterium]
MISFPEFFPLAFIYFDPMYFLFVGPAFLLALWAQARVKSSFGKWSAVPLRSGWTGAQVAARVCELGGAEGVQIEMTPGQLSDHYDPRERVLRLSAENYNGRSVAAAAIAAHEAGHAIQHATRYPMLVLRSAYVPAASLGSWFAFPLLFAGMIFRYPPLIFIGIALFGAVVLFQFITLPVEFDASARAKRVLADSGIISDEEEMDGVRSVLGAAALTYVAATIQAVLTLLYYLWRSGLLGRR